VVLLPFLVELVGDKISKARKRELGLCTSKFRVVCKSITMAKVPIAFLLVKLGLHKSIAKERKLVPHRLVARGSLVVSNKKEVLYTHNNSTLVNHNSLSGHVQSVHTLGTLARTLPKQLLESNYYLVLIS